MSELMPQFAGAGSKPAGFHECLSEMHGALYGDDSLYRELEQSLRKTAHKDVWEPGIVENGHAFFDPFTQILPRFERVRPSDSVMSVYVAALAHMHGVAGTCRDTMPHNQRIEFFASAPERWPQRFEIVCAKIIEKYKGVQPSIAVTPAETPVIG
jgi:hypothetical protein